MRKFVIPFLLASVAATPALAGPRDQNDRAQARAEQQQAKDARQSAREDKQQARTERPMVRRDQQQAPQARQENVANVRQQQAPQARQENVANVRQQQVRPDRAVPQRVNQRPVIDRETLVEQRNARTNNIRQGVQERRDQAVENRIARQQNNAHARPPVVSNTPRPGTQPPPPAAVRPSSSQAQHWNTNWRNNSRYDWHNYRNRHRSLFHLSFYYDPFGWNYSPFQIGWRMWPSYYSSRFWINDPWYYRLPYAPPGTQWVRYYDDAVLVDTWSGQVVDVLYNFFW